MPKSPAHLESRNFQGFSPETITFLKDLRANNNKAWFEDNRERYQDVLLMPFQNLVRDLAAYMVEIDPNFDVTSIKKSVSRIYRDIRFSKDKSPYRPNMWLSFKRATKDWKLEPVYFFEVMPEIYRYGVGFYSPTKGTMNALRARIDYHPKEVEAINALLAPNSEFALMGEEYKRPVGTASAQLPPELRSWYQKKEVFVIRSCPPDAILFSSGLVENVAGDFAFLKPLYNFFWELR